MLKADMKKEFASCDTFVMLDRANGKVVFGKNSDRPRGECQEVVHCIAKSNSSGEMLQV